MKRLVFLSILFLSLNSSAQNRQITDKEEINGIKDNIIKTCNSINNIRCTFVHEKSVSLLEDNISHEGEMLFMSPNNLHWKNISPEKQSFTIRNDSVKIVNDNGISVMPINEHLIFREISKIINNSVSGNSIIDENNFTPSFEENGNYIIVNMKPKKNRMRNVLGNISLHFDKSSLLIHKIEMTDNNNDTTTITLSDIHINQDLDNSLFNF